ncbi:sugar phosphate isomerase/epimerase family protein [Adhaeretor mobilis]|uniref:Fructoselysine 3-epimerase n=1 Tax=Adhaeretor mobilis TaxID=1930276 RepID=A0A517MQM4_9BACT|nr:sugar phosphate isomerase/epimerase family protein [Adhaeretor mobilis]QDS97181.1 fructoselysine 3-epimerase [Adhaeretor mobilis]
MTINNEANPPARHSNRREFLAAGAVAIGASSLASAASPAAETAKAAATAKSGMGSALSDRIYKSAKWSMIGEPGSVEEKFALMKRLGYDGMELESPIGLDPVEVRAATQATGMPVHGVVNMRHWEIRLSDPDPKVQAQAVEILEQCLQESAAFGGNSVLLVPGRVTGEKETHDQVWQRSIAGIRKTLPLASKLGVRILIENVWNGFCETPEQLRDYLDEIDSPWVGSYFDIGNVQKFSPSADWIKVLGKRIVKVDVKDWGVEAGFCKIGDGDVDWPAVREALREIGFTGWSTAEVSGGDAARLQDISQRMDKSLLASGSRSTHRPSGAS